MLKGQRTSRRLWRARRGWPTLLAAAIAVVVSAGPASGQLQVDIGEHALEPNTPAQQIELDVTGGNAVAGFDFRLQVGDGTAGPTVEQIDLEDGTIFDGNNTGQSEGTSTPWQQFLSITTETGSVEAEGLLATIEFDTSDLGDGEFDLTMTDVEGSDSAFFVTVDTTGDGEEDSVEEVSASFIEGLLIVGEGTGRFESLAEGAPRNTRRIADGLDSLAAESPDDELLRIIDEDVLDGLDGAEAAAAFEDLAPALGPAAQEPLTPVTFDNAQLVNFTLMRQLTARRRGLPTAATGQTATEGIGPPMLAGSTHNPLVLADAIRQTSNESQNASRLASNNDDIPADSDDANDAAEDGEDDQRWNLIFQAVGVFENQQTDDDFLGYRADSFGGILGADYELFDDFALGLAASYLWTDVTLKRDRGDHDIQTVRFGPYLSYAPEPWFIDATITYGYHRFDSTRRLPETGDEADSEHDGHDVSASVGGGYVFSFNGFELIPLASLQYVYLREDSYRESGDIALDVDSRTADSLRSRLGVRAHQTFELDDIALVPEATLGWERELLSQDHRTTARFNGGGDSFTVRAGEPNEDAVFAGIGLNALWTDAFSTFLRYDGIYHGDGEAHAATGGVNIRF